MIPDDFANSSNKVDAAANTPFNELENRLLIAICNSGGDIYCKSTAAGAKKKIIWSSVRNLWKYWIRRKRHVYNITYPGRTPLPLFERSEDSLKDRYNMIRKKEKAKNI